MPTGRQKQSQFIVSVRIASSQSPRNDCQTLFCRSLKTFLNPDSNCFHNFFINFWSFSTPYSFAALIRLSPLIKGDRMPTCRHSGGLLVAVIEGVHGHFFLFVGFLEPFSQFSYLELLRFESAFFFFRSSPL